MIRFGIVGAGNIAHKFAKDIKVVDNTKLVAIASRNIERANAFKEKYQLDYSYGNYNEMAVEDKIDAVYIATPHNYHKEQSIMFLKQQKHVLCEKTVALTESDWDEMVQVAKENNVLLMEAMWTRFLPVHQKVLEIVKEKQYGELLLLDLPFCINLLPHTTDDKRILNINLAGGSLLDVGVYPVSYFKFLTDARIKTLTANADFYKTGVDLFVEVDITLNNKVNTKANLKCAVDRETDNAATLTFEKAVVRVPNFHRGTDLIVNDIKTEYPFLSDGFEYQIDSFVKTILNGETENKTMTYNKTKEVMALLDRIRKTIGLEYPEEK